jgi:uncharacterized membrane protein YfcA
MKHPLFTIGRVLVSLRQKRVDVRTAVIFAVAGIPGAWLGALADQVIPQRLFAGLFAALLAWVGIRLLTTGKQSHEEIVEEAHRDDEPRPGLPYETPRGVVSRDFVDAQGIRHTYRYNLAAGFATKSLDWWSQCAVPGSQALGLKNSGCS